MSKAALRTAKPVVARPTAAARSAPAAAAPAAYSADLVTLTSPQSRGAEAIRALRAHLLAQHLNAGRRSLVVCAATVDVGCTFVATNLAVAMAQVGIKTLLVDADLRAPAIDKIIRPPAPATGLVQCLSAQGAPISDYIQDDVLPNLSVFYSGGPAANAQELLTHDWFEEVMNHCLREYDLTIVDTPPANASADVRRISNVMGYSLIVARRNRSVVADVKTLADQLADDHVKVVGAVMNTD